MRTATIMRAGWTTSLRTKLLALLLACSLIPILVLSWHNERALERSFWQRTEERARGIADRTADTLDELFADSIDHIADIAPHLTVEDASTAGFLEEAKHHEAVWKRAFVTDPSGRILMSSDPQAVGTSLAGRVFFERARSGEPPVPVFWVDGTDPIVAVAARLQRPGGEVLGGVVVAYISLETVRARLQSMAKLAAPGSYGLIVDDDLLCIAHGLDPGMELRPMVALTEARRQEAAHGGRLGGRVEGLGRPITVGCEEARGCHEALVRPGGALPFRRMPRQDRGALRVTGTRLSALPWTVFVVVPEAAFASQIADERRTLSVMALFVLTGAVLVGVLLHRRLARPLEDLADTARRIGEGDLAARAPVAGSLEVASLAATFNSMAERLSDQTRRLRDEEARYRTLFEQSPDGILLCDRETTLPILFNERAHRMLGYDRDEFGRLGMADHAAGDVEETRAGLAEVLSGGEGEFEAKLRTREGAIAQVQVSARAVELSGRTASHVVFHDVTERARRDHHLAVLSRIALGINRSLEMDRLAVDSLERTCEAVSADGGAIYLLDPGGKVLDLRYQRDLSGRDLEAVRSLQVGEGAAGLSVEKRSPVAMDAVTGRPGFHQPRAPDGKPGFHQASAPMIVKDQVIGSLAVFRRSSGRGFDPADLRLLQGIADHLAVAAGNARLHQDLRETTENLARTQQAALQGHRLRALGEMASGIAHDINNALSPILGFSDLLLRRARWDEDTENDLRIIRTSASDIASMVARLREFYRKRPERELLLPVEVRALVEQSIQLTQPRWRDVPQEKGRVIEVRADLAEGLPPILGIEAEMRESLMNLIMNACDAMPEGGRLTVRGRFDPPWIVLEVEDTGGGMTEDVRERCLEPFFSTKQERGSGMGLSVVYGIVMRHEGEVDIRSAPGEGTTIVLRFPAAREGRPGTERLPVLVPPSRILCVDDEPLIRDFLRRALTDLGHSVEVASGGQAGIDAFTPGRFEVVITDLGMPGGVDGRAVAAAVKGRSPATAVILLTGWGTRMGVEEAVPPGVDKVLSKPVTARQLQTALAEVLSRPRGN